MPPKKRTAGKHGIHPRARAKVRKAIRKYYK